MVQSTGPTDQPSAIHRRRRGSLIVSASLPRQQMGDDRPLVSRSHRQRCQESLARSHGTQVPRALTCLRSSQTPTPPATATTAPPPPPPPTTTTAVSVAESRETEHQFHDTSCRFSHCVDGEIHARSGRLQQRKWYW
jgi:hypothetical protein